MSKPNKTTLRDYTPSTYTNAVSLAVAALKDPDSFNQPLYVVFRSGWRVVESLPSQGCTAVYSNGSTEILEYSFETKTHRSAPPIPDGTPFYEVDAA